MVVTYGNSNQTIILFPLWKVHFNGEFLSLFLRRFLLPFRKFLLLFGRTFLSSRRFSFCILNIMSFSFSFYVSSLSPEICRGA